MELVYYHLIVLVRKQFLLNALLECFRIILASISLCKTSCIIPMHAVLDNLLANHRLCQQEYIIIKKDLLLCTLEFWDSVLVIIPGEILLKLSFSDFLQ